MRLHRAVFRRGRSGVIISPEVYRYVCPQKAGSHGVRFDLYPYSFKQRNLNALCMIQKHISYGLYSAW